MTQFDIQSFLKNGAFVRHNDGCFYLWVGSLFDQVIKIQENQLIADSPGVQSMDFFSHELLTLGAGPCYKLSQAELLTALKQAGLSKPMVGFVKGDFAEPSKSSFESSFVEIQKQISQTELRKAVPIVFARSQKTPTIEGRRQMMISLITKTAELPAEQIYPFGFWGAQYGVIGATPEVLFIRNGYEIKTMALAGTLPKIHLSQLAFSDEQILKEQFLNDPKERFEHDLVVQDIGQRLQKIGTVKTDQTEVVAYPKLYHLRTWIGLHADTKIESTTQSLVQALHPTAALGCFPRTAKVGLSWLSTLPEQSNRSFFGAPVVFNLNQENSLALVAIRNLIWDEGGARIGTGCGIVASSQLEKEWKELASKREFVYDLLGIEQQPAVGAQ